MKNIITHRCGWFDAYPREAATKTFAGSSWEAVVGARDRGREFSAAEVKKIPRSAAGS
jgi:hypothetical protein